MAAQFVQHGPVTAGATASRVRYQLSAREASDVLGHSEVSQTTNTYVGRKAVSRRPADVLAALGGDQNGSWTEARSATTRKMAGDLRKWWS